MLEKDLVNQFNEYLLSNNYLFGNEIRMGIGIPDIMVGLQLKPGSVYLNDYLHLSLLNTINNHNYEKVTEVQECMKLPRAKVVKILKELTLLGVVDLNGDSFEVIKNVDLENQGVNISIEVKIRDWKNGLIQAQRYLTFSDYSYLAIHSDYTKNIDLDLAKSLGIGLISISEIGLKELSTPKKSLKCNNLFKNISMSYLQKSNVDMAKDDFFFGLA